MQPKRKLNKKPLEVNIVFVPISRNILTLAARLQQIALDLFAAVPLRSSLIDRKAIAKQLKDENAKLTYFEKMVAHEITDSRKK